jgi:hypothetical protein
MVEPGTLASIAPEEIMLLSYATKQGITTAQRSTVDAEFVVQTTFTDGRPARHCRASAALIGQLSELTATRGISLRERERDYPDQIGVLDIRSQMLSEPGYPLLIFSNRQQTELAIIDDSHAAVITLPRTELDRLERGCLQ